MRRTAKVLEGSGPEQRNQGSCRGRGAFEHHLPRAKQFNATFPSPLNSAEHILPVRRHQRTTPERCLGLLLRLLLPGGV